MNTTLYKGNVYRVVFSLEEEAALKAAGWSIDAPEGDVIPYTAVKPEKLAKADPEPEPKHGKK